MASGAIFSFLTIRPRRRTCAPLWPSPSPAPTPARPKSSSTWPTIPCWMRRDSSLFGKVVEGMDVVDKLYSGYGEMRPQSQIDPGRVEEGTNAYLIPRFPKLDYIKRAIFLSTEPRL